MPDYACIYANGLFIKDITKTLIERDMAIRADQVETFPMYLKNGKVKSGSNEYSMLILVERAKLDEVMDALQSLNQWDKPILAYALPVLAIAGI